MDLVSIAIITFDRPKFLKYSIDAVLNQTYENFELLIIDNGSGADTEELLSTFSDKRIKIFKSSSNFRENYNYPFFVASGKYLIITHDDDFMQPDLIQKEVDAIINNPKVVAVSCNMKGIDNDGAIKLQSMNNEIYNVFYSKGDYWKMFNSEHYIFTPTVLFDLEFMRRHSLIFEIDRIGPACDQFLWYKILQNDVKILVLSDTLYNYRLHDNQDSVVNGPNMNFDLLLTFIELNLLNPTKLRVLFASLISLLINYKKSSFGVFKLRKAYFLLKNSQLSFLSKIWIRLYITIPLIQKIRSRFLRFVN
jgi:glycosyltransferase involved in cell wall biosynthesis